MNNKRDSIYNSSQGALLKFFTLSMTLGISVLASFFDDKSCYVTILVQAVNNLYDFYETTNNILYDKVIRTESIVVCASSVLAICYSIIALTDIYAWMSGMIAKLFGVLLVALPIAFLYYDYHLNILKEDEVK